MTPDRLDIRPPLVLSLCDRTGVMVQPWVRAGYRAFIVDTQHPKGEHQDPDQPLLTRVGADISTWLPPLDTYALVVGFPPCTHLAKSGARWMKEKGLSALIEGLTLVERCRYIAEWTGAPYCIENPSGTLSTYWRKPDHAFDPCDFGGYIDPPVDAYTKLTNLWVGNGFVMPEKRRVEPVEGSKMHRVPPGPERMNIRSATPAGFAQAVFEANAPEARTDLLGVTAC